jgi:hypothetical protein
VGVRKFVGDADGVMLTNEFPTIRVEEKDLRDFKMANKYGITQGLIKEVPEDALDWEINNDVSDEDANELLKNYAKLKSTLQTIDSLPIAQKILTMAQEQDKPKKTLSLIQSRVDELTPDDLDFVRREDMQGTDNARK